MKKTWKTKLSLTLALLGATVAILSGTILIDSDAKAITADQEKSFYNGHSVVRKTILSGIKTCYNSTYMRSEVTNLGDFSSFSALFRNTNSKGDTVPLPTGLTNISDGNISCYGLFFGDQNAAGEAGTFAGLFSLSGKRPSASTEIAKTELLEKMGYFRSGNDASSNKQCIYFKYDQTSSGVASVIDTDKICAMLDGNNKITALTVDSGNGSYEKTILTGNFFKEEGGKISIPRLATTTTIQGYTQITTPKTDKGVGDTWADFSADLRSKVSSLGEITVSRNLHGYNAVYKYKLNGGSLQENVNYFIDGHGSDISFKIKNNSWTQAANAAINYLSNGEFSSIGNLSDREQLELLSLELKHYFFSGKDTNTFWMCDAADWANQGGFYSGTEIHLSSNGEVNPNCRINTSIVVNNSTINGFAGGKLSSSTKYTLAQTIAKINELVGDVKSADKEKCNTAASNARQSAQRLLEQSHTSEEYRARAQATIDSLDKVKQDHGEYWYEEGDAILCYAFTGLDGDTVQTPTDSPGASDSGDISGGTSGGSTSDADVSSLTACYESAGVLGWIACPVLEAMGGVVEKLYGFIERNFLQVDSGLVNDPGTRSGWTQFRDFSNTLFAIMFVIIILSQVTGLGLSNYNVKKILPRLIMVVVLVNISFILCQLAVDISNLVGFSLNGMFEGFASTAADTKGGVPFDLGTVAGGILGSALGVGGTVVVLGVLAVTIPWELWLFPMILAIIACVISILFFFILLGVRQAGIIILITLAPLAIVCYALPNTKSLFDKWFKLFTALLLVYPICGVLMGGGKFASTLLLITSYNTDAGAFFTIVAMLLAVVPFFLVPSVLRSSMVAMGNLGAKIATFGSRVGGGLTRGIRNSELGRDIQRQQQMRYADRAAQRLERRSERTGGLSPRNQRRLNRYNSRYNRMAYEDIRAGGVDQRLTPGSSQREAAEQAARSRQENEDISGRQDLYRGGSMASIIAGHADPVNGNNNDELEDELSAYMDRIITGEAADGTRLTDDEVNDSVMNAQALINTLSDQGTSGARAKVEQSFARAMNRHQAIFGDATQRGRLTNTFGSLASRTSAKYGKDYKKDSPGTAAMLGDIAQGNFSRAGSFIASGRTDSRGNSVLRSTHYSGAGVSGMNTEDFSKLKAYGANNILDGIRAGQINGSDARAAARMTDEVLNSGVYSPDADVRDVLEQIRTAGYSAGGAINGRSAGSLAISGASTGALETMVSDVSGIADSAAWGSLSAAEQSNFRQLFDNIRETLDNDTLSAANADQLQQALKIAHDRGFTDASGNVIGAFSGTPHLKIDHSAPQPIVVPPVPQGWTEGGMWTGGGSGPSKQQEIAYQEWAKIKARADMQNNGGNP